MKTNLLNFGEAIEALKGGKCVARQGWNGKDMFIYLNKGSLANDLLLVGDYEGIDKSLFEKGDNGTVARLPNINMKTASGSTLTGWLASQTDILATDWKILD